MERGSPTGESTRTTAPGSMRLGTWAGPTLPSLYLESFTDERLPCGTKWLLGAVSCGYVSDKDKRHVITQSVGREWGVGMGNIIDNIKYNVSHWFQPETIIVQLKLNIKNIVDADFFAGLKFC